MNLRAGKKFMDSFRILVKGGAGGNGIPKFGGVGGKGGDIYAEGKLALSLYETKMACKKHICKASDGEHSRQHRLLGEYGKDIIVTIPCGSTVHFDTGGYLGEVINPGDTILIARGGAGGSPVNGFIGQRGEERYIQFFLKIIADVGLVGFPNAGKSTLLRAISKAKPKIASYPFTTLHPMVGIIQYDDLRTVSMADLPGLVEGAWTNIGMGHKFLRHVERTKILAFVVDIQGFRLGPSFPYRSAFENIILLNKELEMYNPELVEKPCLLLLNKMDKENAAEKYEELKEQLRNIKDVAESMPEEMLPDRFVTFGDVVPCSVKKDRNSIHSIKEKIRTLLDAYYSEEKDIEKLRDNITAQLYESEGKLI